MIAYEDAGAAMDWPVRAFGFRQLKRLTDKKDEWSTANWNSRAALLHLHGTSLNTTPH
jgi:uncharacterized glyoxalase superfamily protein PhnB